MANGPGFGFSWVKYNMVFSDAKYTDIGVPLFFVPRIYSVRKLYFCILRFTYLPINVTLIAKMASFGQMQCNVTPLNVN